MSPPRVDSAAAAREVVSPVRWGFIFVACPLPLSEQQRDDLVRLAAQAWFADLPEVRFDWTGCEGVVRPSSEVVSLGTFVGQLFVAQVNLADRSGEVRFLVAEAQLQQMAGEA